MKRKPLKPIVRRLFQLSQNLHLRAYENYQPVVGNASAPPGTRECEARWKIIQQVLRENDCNSLVDLGCSEGYYVLQASQLGLGFCLGVDFDLRRIFTCQSQVVLNDVPRAAFLVSEVTPELLESLPEIDSVIFLSVLHHIMYQKGPDHCRELLQRLSKRVKKVMLFEMGQSDEHLESWAKDMPDMGDDPHKWIAEFLQSAGFGEVRKIGTTPSYLKEIERALFAVFPA